MMQQMIIERTRQNLQDMLGLPKSRKVRERDLGELPPGDEGVVLTIENMRRLARKDASRPVMKAIAAKVLAECRCEPGTEESDYKIIRAMYRYVIDNVRYKNDPEHQEYVTTPEYLLTVSHEGDCDDMATAFASLALALGYAVRFKVIAWKSHTYSHVYNEIYVPSLRKWLPMDCVYQVLGNRFKGFGYEKAPVIRKQTFDV